MTTHDNRQSVTDNVLATIRSGNTRMKPRWHFILRAILVFVGVFIVSIGIVYLASLIHFLLRQNGMWFAPDIGMRGMGMLLVSLPWVLIVAAILFIVVLEILVRRYAFAYKQPLVYSLVGIIALATLATFLIGKTGMHGMMYRAAREGTLPAGAPLYGPFPFGEYAEIHPGIIFENTDADTFILERVDGTPLTVVITKTTRIPNTYTLTQGQRVIVFGVPVNGIIEAVRIRPERDDAFIPFDSRRDKRGPRNEEYSFGDMPREEPHIPIQYPQEEQ
jgi:hypothetical protein